MKPTNAQRRFLGALDIVDGTDSWGDVFSHYDSRGWEDDNPARTLQMCNFDRTADACKARGWIAVEDVTLDGRVIGHTISLTESGKRAMGVRP